MEKVAVKYIGKRETYIDGTYGSRIAFTKGQSVLVPADLAAKMLRHPDVYAKGDAKKAEVVEVQEQPVVDEDSQAIRDRIAVMDKTALESFVKTTYRMDIDKRKSVESLRQQAINLVDQYGAV